MDCSPLGSSVPGILQARILEWVTTCTESESRSVVSDSLPPHDYRVHGILQARILEWVASPFSRGSSRPRDRTGVSCIAGGFFITLPTELSGKPTCSRKPNQTKTKQNTKQPFNPLYYNICIIMVGLEPNPQCLCSLPILTTRGCRKKLWQELKHYCSKQHIIYAFILTKIIRLAH